MYTLPRAQTDAFNKDSNNLNNSNNSNENVAEHKIEMGNNPTLIVPISPAQKKSLTITPSPYQNSMIIEQQSDADKLLRPYRNSTVTHQ